MPRRAALAEARVGLGPRGPAARWGARRDCPARRALGGEGRAAQAAARRVRRAPRVGRAHRRRPGRVPASVSRPARRGGGGAAVGVARVRAGRPVQAEDRRAAGADGRAPRALRRRARRGRRDAAAPRLRVPVQPADGPRGAADGHGLGAGTARLAGGPVPRVPRARRELAGRARRLRVGRARGGAARGAEAGARAGAGAAPPAAQRGGRRGEAAQPVPAVDGAGAGQSTSACGGGWGRRSSWCRSTRTSRASPGCWA